MSGYADLGGKKTGFLYKAFCALGLMWVNKSLNPTNCAFINPLRNLIFGNSLKTTVCGCINDRLKVSPEKQNNSPNLCFKKEKKKKDYTEVSMAWASPSVSASFH